MLAVFWQPFTSVPITVYVMVLAGTNDTPSVTPPVHAYAIAPLPVRVTFPPAQIDPVEVFAPTAGKAFTVTVVLAVPVHPFASVPVTVYVVVVIGVTVTDEPF